MLIEEPLIPATRYDVAYVRFHDALFLLVNEASRDVPANMIIGDLESIKHFVLTAQLNMAAAIVIDKTKMDEDRSIQ
jgi:hypothetical protein